MYEGTKLSPQDVDWLMYEAPLWQQATSNASFVIFCFVVCALGFEIHYRVKRIYMERKSKG